MGAWNSNRMRGLESSGTRSGETKVWFNVLDFDDKYVSVKVCGLQMAEKEAILV